MRYFAVRLMVMLHYVYKASERFTDVIKSNHYHKTVHITKISLFPET